MHTFPCQFYFTRRISTLLSCAYINNRSAKTLENAKRYALCVCVCVRLSLRPMCTIGMFHARNIHVKYAINL